MSTHIICFDGKIRKMSVLFFAEKVSCLKLSEAVMSIIKC